MSSTRIYITPVFVECAVPEVSEGGFISMLHDGLSSFFRRSQQSILSGKARLKYDSLTRASLQPRLSSLQTAEGCPEPARRTQPSPDGGREEERLQGGRRRAEVTYCLTDSPSTFKDALLLQHALITLVFTQRSPLSSWPLSSVGWKTLTSSAPPSPSSSDNFSRTHICPNALKPNPNHRIDNTLRLLVLVVQRSCPQSLNAADCGARI